MVGSWTCRSGVLGFDRLEPLPRKSAKNHLGTILVSRTRLHRASTHLHGQTDGLLAIHEALPTAFQDAGESNGLFDRLTQPPPLQANDKLVWGDMVEYPDYGLATRDVHAAIGLSSFLGRIGKGNQVRMGDNYSFEDLRNFPAIIIGGGQ